MHAAHVAAAAVLATALGAAAPEEAHAQAKIFIPNCNSLPCDVVVPGYVDRVGKSVVPWTAQLSMPSGICLYVNRSVSDADLAIAVVAPNGTIYTDVANRVTIKTIPVPGWYTIQVTSRPPALEQLFAVRITAFASSSCTGTVPR